MDQDSLSEAHAEIETMSEQIGMMNQEMLALEARTRALEAALLSKLLHKGTCSWVYNDFSGSCDCGVLAALTEPTPPAGGQG